MHADVTHGRHTGADLHGDLHAARAHVPLNECRRVVQPPCERLPHARRQLVWRAVEKLERQAVHHIHGMVQVQGSLQGPLRRVGCRSRLRLALAGCQAPHLLLQALLLLLLQQLPLQPLPLQQAQQLVLRGLRLTLLPLLLAWQLLLVGGACSLPCGCHCSHHQLRLEGLLLLVGGPESLSCRVTNSPRQPLLELWLLGGSCSLAWLILGEGLGGACRQCQCLSL